MLLRKILTMPPIQNKVNEPELRKDFGKFCRMRLKWYFRNDPTSNFSEKTSSTPKSSWKLPTGHPNLEVFLSECEFFFKVVDSKLGYSNFSKREWQTMRALADDRSMVIKKTDKGSTAVVWDRNDYILEVERQLNDANAYKDVSFNEKILQDLVGTSKQFFKTSNL